MRRGKKKERKEEGKRKTMLSQSSRRNANQMQKLRKGEPGKQEDNFAKARSLMHHVNAQMKQIAMPRSMRKVCIVVLSSIVNRDVFIVIVFAGVESERVEMLQEPAWRARETRWESRTSSPLAGKGGRCR